MSRTPHDDIDIDHLCRLARLALAPEERALVQSDLQRIITMVDAMQAVETDRVAPLAHPLEARQALRPDEITELNQREILQAGAPAVRDGLYLVPRVVE